MAKKSMSQKRALRKQQERAAMNNIFNVFFAGLGAEFVLFLIYKYYVSGNVNTALAWGGFLRVLVWVALAVAALGFGVAIVKKADRNICKTALYTAFSGLFLSFASFASTRFYETGLFGLLIAVPVATVLGLVYFLYQRECFVSTTLLAGSLFTITVCGKGLDSYWATLVAVCAVAVVVGLVVLMVLLNMVKKNDGKLREIRIFPSGCNYRVMFAVCLLCIATILVVLFAPALSFYLTWILVIALFAELGLFTTKMM